MDGFPGSGVFDFSGLLIGLRILISGKNTECFFVYDYSRPDGDDVNWVPVRANVINDSIPFNEIASQALQLILEGFATVGIFKNARTPCNYSVMKDLVLWVRSETLGDAGIIAQSVQSA